MPSALSAIPPLSSCLLAVASVKGVWVQSARGDQNLTPQNASTDYFYGMVQTGKD